jgi:hypothetical protein
MAPCACSVHEGSVDSALVHDLTVAADYYPRRSVRNENASAGEPRRVALIDLLPSVSPMDARHTKNQPAVEHTGGKHEDGSDDSSLQVTHRPVGA